MSKWVNQFRSKVKKIIPHSRKRILDETYDIKDTLGGGLFSVVKKAVNKKTGELVAIKIYDKSRLTSYDRECTLTEVELLKALKHPNIVKMISTIDTRSRLYLVEELMMGGDLLELIRKKKKFTEKDACRLFSQVLTAIAYLHVNNIAHRDIKPDNMLLSSDSEDATVKLADFGFAKRVGTGPLLTPCGSPVYTAPEIVREDTYDKSVDVWSAGVLLYIMLCGYPPFYHRNPSKLFEEIKKADFDFPAEQWNSISDLAKDLVSAMLKANPTDRITAQQALEHPWIVLMRSESSESTPTVKPDTPPPSPPLILPSFPSSPSSPSPCSSSSSISASSCSIPPMRSTSLPTSTTTTASAADTVMDKKAFKEKINRVLDQGTQFNLCPATSSPLWARRHKSNLPPIIDNCDKNNINPDHNDKETSDKSDKSDKSLKGSKEIDKGNRRERVDEKPRKMTNEGKEKESEGYKSEGGGSSIEAFSLSMSRSSSDSCSEDGFSFINNAND